LKESADHGPAYDATRGIIGKFGVGFYSAFMVGETVEVRSSQPTKRTATYHLRYGQVLVVLEHFRLRVLEGEEEDDQVRGTAIVIHLKPDFMEYCDKDRVEVVLKKYSNFVNFPIFLNGERVDTMDAIWTKDPRKLTTTSILRFIDSLPMPMMHLLTSYTFALMHPSTSSPVLHPILPFRKVWHGTNGTRSVALFQESAHRIQIT
jgi:HSP90 family molecular chaperone